MRIFLKKAFLFLVFASCFLFLISAFYIKVIGVSPKDIAPQISDSYSYNDKVMFARKKRADILCLGSSMSLNNIHSASITDHFKTNSFLNLSSWGLNIKDIYHLLKVYTRNFKPSTVIIVSNLVDFNDVEKKVDFDMVKNLFEGKNVEYTHLTSFTPRYYFTNMRFSKKAKSSNSIYESLRYDEYGSVPFDATSFNVDSIRWLKKDYFKVDSEQYAYFDSISLYCFTSGVNLLVFQSPFRLGLYNTLHQANLLQLQLHEEALQRILLSRKQHFISGNNKLWNDSLFVDGIHLNALGAEIFTKYCLNEIRIQAQY